MSRQLTIEGRLVQGGLTMIAQKDMKTNQPKTKEGQPVLGNFLAIAVPKQIATATGMIDNPKIGEYFAQFDAQARESFPHLYTTGQNSHPRFAMKWQDGDGVDSNGKSVKDTPGFAGHWIIKCATQLKAPTCWIRNSQGALQQLTEPEKLIKKGHYVAVGIAIDGNGVEPNNAQAVPGLYVTPELVLYVAPGEEIITGPDPNAAFAGINSAAPPAGAPAAGPGLSSPPLPGAAPAAHAGSPLPGAAPAHSGPPLPGAAPAHSGPPLPGAAPAAHAGPPLPGAAPAVAVQPQYAPTASAQGASVQNMLDAGWTIEALLAQGHIVRTA